MNPESEEVAAAWRSMSWTLIVVLLITVLIISALPWIVRQATTPLAQTLSGQ
jgi:membrane protein YdbS with pleckstrin-like domain